MRSRVFSIVAISILAVVASGSAVGPARPSAPSPAAPQAAAYVWTDAQEADRWAAETLARLPLEKKIGQMICPISPPATSPTTIPGWPAGSARPGTSAWACSCSTAGRRVTSPTF